MAVITISRQFGSGGLDVAKLTATLLGYSCLDRGLVREVARMMNVPEWEVEQWDERRHGVIAELLMRVFLTGSCPYHLCASGWDYSGIMVSPTLVEELEGSQIPDPDGIVALTGQVIQDAADRGNLVVVGRGGQVILADRPDALHVRVVAPFSYRCEQVAKREGISPEKAMDLVRRTDQERARYLRHYYQVDWEDESMYHLILNTERTSIDLAADLIATTVRHGLWVLRTEERSTSIPQLDPEEVTKTGSKALSLSAL